MVIKSGCCYCSTRPLAPEQVLIPNISMSSRTAYVEGPVYRHRVGKGTMYRLLAGLIVKGQRRTKGFATKIDRPRPSSVLSAPLCVSVCPPTDRMAARYLPASNRRSVTSPTGAPFLPSGYVLCNLQFQTWKIYLHRPSPEPRHGNSKATSIESGHLQSYFSTRTCLHRHVGSLSQKCLNDS